MRNFHKLCQIGLGFSLIELMLVITIIGILAAVGLPAYNLYALKSKYAEAYVGIAAIQKGEIAYFNENGHFIELGSLGSYGDDGASGYLATGKKFAIYGVYPDDETQPRLDWKEIGSPIVHGSFNAFGYMAPSGYWNDTGDLYRAIYTPGIGYNPQTWGGGNFGTFKLNSSEGCNQLFQFDQMGFTPANNRNWSIVIAGINFKATEPEQCGHVFQTIEADRGGSAKIGGLVLINYGE